jgi:hypothetical protein
MWPMVTGESFFACVVPSVINAGYAVNAPMLLDPTHGILHRTAALLCQLSQFLARIALSMILSSSFAAT